MKTIFSICATLLFPFVSLTAQAAEPDVSGFIPPAAPEKFARPADFKIEKPCPLDIREIAKKYSDNAAWKTKVESLKSRVQSVNASGKWKADGKSLDAHKCPEWFADAKFGMFIDWGVWSVGAYAPKKERGAMYPDWYLYNIYTDAKLKKYHEKNWGADVHRDNLISLFHNGKFDAEKLVKLAKDSGMKYVVPFNKHHDGYCLWNSSLTLRNSLKMYPHRDFVSEIVKACRTENIKFGFYFSIDEWEYPVYADDGKIEAYTWGGKRKPYTPDMEHLASGKIAVKDFVKDYIVPQAAEFIDKFSPDLIWFDGEWNTFASKNGSYDIAAYFYNVNDGLKDVAINDRYGLYDENEFGVDKQNKHKWLRCLRGDYFTSEFGDTDEQLAESEPRPWEACRSISQSYGFNWQDNASNVMSLREFVDFFVDIVARGGNLLMLVNLDADGAIPDVQRERLLGIGKWLGENAEAIYCTRPLAPFADKNATYTKSKDNKFGYAIVKNVKDGQAKIASKIRDGEKIVRVSDASPLKWSRLDGNTVVVYFPADTAADALPFAIKMPL